MSDSVRIDIEIDEEVLKVALEDLQIAHNPPTITTNWQEVKKHLGRAGFHKEEFGHYIHAENHIALQTLPPSYVRLPLFRLVPRIRETLLHELRHAHQYLTWPEARKERMRDGGYWLSDCEVDARKWAFAAAQKEKFRGLVTVKRLQVGEGMRLP